MENKDKMKNKLTDQEDWNSVPMKQQNYKQLNINISVHFITCTLVTAFYDFHFYKYMSIADILTVLDKSHQCRFTYTVQNSYMYIGYTYK